MDRAELIELAAPPCAECERPTIRMEASWRFGENGWHVARADLICPDGHRTPVEPFD
jgi:hypothetical protein